LTWTTFSTSAIRIHRSIPLSLSISFSLHFQTSLPMYVAIEFIVVPFSSICCTVLTYADESCMRRLRNESERVCSSCRANLKRRRRLWVSFMPQIILLLSLYLCHQLKHDHFQLPCRCARSSLEDTRRWRGACERLCLMLVEYFATPK
jgi:hypothetical protein